MVNNLNEIAELAHHGPEDLFLSLIMLVGSFFYVDNCAHRLSTIRNADKILVLTEEGIKEQGTHDQLMEERGIYYNLYQAQFRDRILDSAR